MKLFLNRRWACRALALFAFAAVNDTALAYDSPNFDLPLLERDALDLADGKVNNIVEILAGVAGNVSDSKLIDTDLQERTLALALNLNPLNVNARNAHHALSRGQPPPKTAFSRESVSAVAETLWSEASGIVRDRAASPDAVKLSIYLKELSLLLHPAPPRGRISDYSRSVSRVSLRPWDTVLKLQPDQNPSSKKIALLLFEDLAVAKPAPPRPDPRPAPTSPPPRKSPANPTPNPKPTPTPTSSTDDLLRHLIYLCDFESSKGSIDQSPRKNHGSVIGASTGEGRDSSSKKSLYFGKNTDVLKLPIDISPSEVPEATVCLWVKTEGPPKRFAELVSQRHPEKKRLDRAIIFEHRKGNWMWGVYRGSDGWALNSDLPLDESRWTFVAATFDHPKCLTRLYIDGEMAEYLSSHGPGRSELYIGNGNPSKLFQGWIDDLCLFNRVLEKEEIDRIGTGGAFAELARKSVGAPPSTLQPNRRPAPSPPQKNSLSEGLIYACNFEESDGTLDQSPARNHGMMLGAEIVPGVNPNQKAVRFDGATTRIIIQESIQPLKFPNLTLSVWLKPEEPKNKVAVFFSNGDGSRRGIRLMRSEEEFNWSLNCGVNHDLQAEEVRFGDWVHMACVYENLDNRATFYVNGKAHRTDEAVPAIGRTYFAVGRSPTFGNPYRGLVDNLLIYNWALNETQIKALYDSTGKNGKSAPSKKVSVEEARTIVRPSFLENRLPNGRPPIDWCKYHTIDGDQSRGELALRFDLSALRSSNSKYTKCRLEGTVSEHQRAGTDSEIMLLSSRGQKITSINGAALEQVLKFPIPLAMLPSEGDLVLTLRCGNDELLLEKSAPDDVKLVLE